MNKNSCTNFIKTLSTQIILVDLIVMPQGVGSIVNT